MMAVSFDRGRLLPTAGLRVLPRGQEAPLSPTAAALPVLTARRPTLTAHRPLPLPLPPLAPPPAAHGSDSQSPGYDRPRNGYGAGAGQIRSTRTATAFESQRQLAAADDAAQRYRADLDGRTRDRRRAKDTAAPTTEQRAELRRRKWRARLERWARGGDGDDSSEDNTSNDDSEGSKRGDSPGPTARRLVFAILVWTTRCTWTTTTTTTTTLNGRTTTPFLDPRRLLAALQRGQGDTDDDDEG